MTSKWPICNVCLSFVIFQKWDKSEEFAKVNFSLFVWVSGLYLVTAHSAIGCHGDTNIINNYWTRLSIVICQWRVDNWLLIIDYYWSARHWQIAIFYDITKLNNCFIIRSQFVFLFICEEICHFHALERFARRTKAWFHLRMTILVPRARRFLVMWSVTN